MDSLDNYTMIIPACPICFQDYITVRKDNSFGKTCSMKCSAVNAKKTREETTMKKYGVKNVSELKEVKEKISNNHKQENNIKIALEKRKQTNLLKYGVENARQSVIVSNKIVNTNIERFGSVSPFGNITVIDKSKATRKERTGVEWASQTSKWREDIKQNWNLKTEKEICDINEKRKKFYQNSIGYDHVWSSPEGKEKRKKTWQDKYGVNNPGQSIIVQDKIAKKVFSRIYNKIVLNGEIKPLFTLDEYIGCDYDKIYRWQCQEGHEFEHWYKGRIPRCTVCFPPSDTGTSNEEKEIVNYISSIYNGAIETNTRKIISPLELDIYIPEYELAIEYNGCWCHSTKFKSDRNYHLNKFQECEKKGIRLIQIWDYKWENPTTRAIIENIIKGSLGLMDSINARQCELISCPPIELKDFFEQYNIEGYRGGKIAYALKYKGEVVMAYVFGYNYHGKKDWEMIRGAQKIGIRVIGGASKLMSHFIKDYNPSEITYYTMNDYYTGSSLPHLGFKHVNTHVSYMNYHYKTGEVKARCPNKHQEIKQGYLDGSIAQLWNSGVKVWKYSR